jgi:hypothetical protein
VIYTPVQLNAGCPPGQSQPFSSMKPDGTAVLFSLPAGSIFNLTDVSIVPANMTSAAPTLIMIGLRQVIPGGHVQRWNFAGYIAQNVERSFATPVQFSKDFQVWNISTTVTVNVNLFGYLSM